MTSPSPPQDVFATPAYICELDVALPISDLTPEGPDPARYMQARVLLRRAGRPIGLMVEPFEDGIISASRMQAAVGAYLASGDANSGPDTHTEAGNRHGLGSPSYNANRITVVVCTRDRTADLCRLLDSLQTQVQDTFHIIVVDNAPTNGETRAAVDAHALESRIIYINEPRKGLSWARNAALNALHTEFVAWIDDDEIADPMWIEEILRAFEQNAGADAVSGIVLPGALETRAQAWFEAFGGHSKGRGFETALFRRGQLDGQSHLFPLPPYGVGANMAFRTSKLRNLGGFDTALGAGTATQGGEDTLVFAELLHGGSVVVYHPPALTYHFHRETTAELRRQMQGYGLGLTAHYTALVARHPTIVLQLARLLPTGVRALREQRLNSTTELPADFPLEVLQMKRRGMVLGPLKYVQARVRSRRAGTHHSVERRASTMNNLG